MQTPQFEVRIAQTEAEVQAAQALRYEIFVKELGGDGDMIDHDKGLEMDEFDPYFDHILLYDHARETAPVVGVYRVLPSDKMPQIGRYYSEAEYDLSALMASGRKLLELGRSCLHADYRGGTAMLTLWNGLADYVLSRGIEILFGTASFHGTDVTALTHPLSYLYHNHLAPDHLRTRAVAAHFQTMDLVPKAEVDRKAAMMNTPALIKAYLRLGGFVGDGAFVDRVFNTTDVCLIMDTEKMNAKQRHFYEKMEARS